MKNILFSTIFCLLTIASLGQAKDEKSITDAVEQLRDAMIDGNKTTLENLVSDKLSYGHSSGQLDTKKEFVEKLTSGKSDFVTINLSEQTISISGKTAIVRHKLDATTNDNNKPGEVHLRVMLVWQKAGGDWKLLARQAVKTS